MASKISFFVVLSSSFLFAASVSTSRLLREGLTPELKRALQTGSPFDDIPDVCSGFELIIDQLPEGRDACSCQGRSVECTFKGECPEEDSPGCGDSISYGVNFEGSSLFVSSCAEMHAVELKEVCAEVSIGPDLALDSCKMASYGGEPCDCSICEDGASLNLDCSMHDPRVVSNCTSMSFGQLEPLNPQDLGNFGTTIPPPSKPGTEQETATEPETESKPETETESETASSETASSVDMIKIASSTMALAFLVIMALI